MKLMVEIEILAKWSDRPIWEWVEAIQVSQDQETMRLTADLPNGKYNWPIRAFKFVVE